MEGDPATPQKPPLGALPRLHEPRCWSHCQDGPQGSGSHQSGRKEKANPGTAPLGMMFTKSRADGSPPRGFQLDGHLWAAMERLTDMARGGTLHMT